MLLTNLRSCPYNLCLPFTFSFSFSLLWFLSLWYPNFLTSCIPFPISLSLSHVPCLISSFLPFPCLSLPSLTLLHLVPCSWSYIGSVKINAHWLHSLMHSLSLSLKRCLLFLIFHFLLIKFFHLFNFCFYMVAFMFFFPYIYPFWRLIVCLCFKNIIPVRSTVHDNSVSVFLLVQVFLWLSYWRVCSSWYNFFY